MKIITETPRLIIAKMNKSDADSLFQLTSNLQVMRYFPKALNYVENSQMIEKILDQYEKHGYYFWKLMLRDGTKFIGIAGLLHQVIDAHVETEISYRIKPQYWNFGFATEAAQACKEYAEKILNKNRLTSIIHPENIASKCVAEKLGAKKRMSPPLRGQSMKYMFTDRLCITTPFTRIHRVRPLLSRRSLVLTCL